MLPGSDLGRIATRHEPGSTGENFLAHFGAYATGGDRDFLHARPGLRNTLFGAGRSPGPRLHPNGLGISILRYVSRMARCGADGKRHLIERVVREFAANHFSATRDRSGSDVRS